MERKNKVCEVARKMIRNLKKLIELKNELSDLNKNKNNYVLKRNKATNEDKDYEYFKKILSLNNDEECIEEDIEVIYIKLENYMKKLSEYKNCK